MKRLFFLLPIFLAIFPAIVSAHRSGCHRWHSCPSDTGSYVCGDLGYYSGCPENKLSPIKDQIPAVTPQTNLPSVPKTKVTIPPLKSSVKHPPATQGNKPAILFYTSTKKASYYYCSTDSTWKKLKYRKAYSSEAELLKDYPKRKLHKPCK